MLEFGQSSQAAFGQNILALCAPSSVKRPFRLVSHVLIDSIVVGNATAPELTIILRLVKQGIQLLFDIQEAPMESLLWLRMLLSVGRDST